MGAGPPATSGTVTKGEVEGAPHRFQGDRRVLEDRLRAGALGVPTWKQKQEKVVLDEQKGTLTALPALASPRAGDQREPGLHWARLQTNMGGSVDGCV